MNRTRLALPIALVITSWSLAACEEPPAPASTAPPATLVVGYSALRISLPIFVADQRGIFARHGLRVDLRRYDTAQPLVEELVDGRIDAGGYAALPIVMTVAGQAHQGVRIATGMVEDQAHPVSALLRRAGGPPIESVADLRGHRVGVLPTLAYTAWLDLVLRHAGVDPGEVTVVPIAPPQQVSSLAEGNVDALFTGDPMATAAVASGAGERLGPLAPVPDALGGPQVFGTFLVTEDVARARPADVAALLASLDEAIAEIARDPSTAADAMLPFVREPERPQVRLYPPASYLTSSELTSERLSAETRRIGELGLAASVPDVSGWSLAGATP